MAKMGFIKVSVYLILIFSFGCKNESEDLTYFTRDDFNLTSSLVIDSVTLPKDMYNPIVLKIVRDTILVSQNLPSTDKSFYFLDIYNISKKL